MRKPPAREGADGSALAKAAKAADNAQRREAFRQWMLARDLTIYEVAKGAHVPGSTLYTYMRGLTGSLSGATQESIARAFGSTVGEMFGTKVQRWMPVHGSVRPGGEAVAHIAPTRVARPAWLADGEGLEVYQMDHPTAGPFGLGQWLLVFRATRVRPEELAGALALVDLDGGRRVFCRLVRARGKLVAITMDGMTVKGATVVRAMPFIGMAVPPSA